MTAIKRNYEYKIPSVLLVSSLEINAHTNKVSYSQNKKKHTKIQLQLTCTSNLKTGKNFTTQN